MVPFSLIWTSPPNPVTTASVERQPPWPDSHPVCRAAGNQASAKTSSLAPSRATCVTKPMARSMLAARFRVTGGSREDCGLHDHAFFLRPETTTISQGPLDPFACLMSALTRYFSGHLIRECLWLIVTIEELSFSWFLLGIALDDPFILNKCARPVICLTLSPAHDHRQPIHDLECQRAGDPHHPQTRARLRVPGSSDHRFR